MASGGRSRFEPRNEEIEALRRHAEALERLIEAGAGPRQAVADRIQAILSVGLEHLRLASAEVGRLTAAGFRPWYAASAGDGAPLSQAVRTEAARRSVQAGGVTGAVGADGIGCFAGATLPAFEAGSVVIFLGGDRTAPFDTRDMRFVALLAEVLAAAVGRHRGREPVSENRAELAMMLQNVPAYVASVDRDGRIAAANEAAHRAHRPAASLARDIDCLNAGEPAFGDMERWGEEDGVVRFMRTDRIPYTAPPDLAPRLLVVATDVTELVEKEHLLATANAGLNQFAYIASHDLQEPLRKIGTFTDLLLRGLERNDREDVDYGVRVIKESARRASALINDLFAWSRLTNRPLERSAVSLAVIVRETVADLLSTRPEEAVTIEDDMAADLILADPSKLRQLVENLLSNALKYRHGDRPLRIALRFKPMARGGYTFEIRDTGIGFDPAYAQAIFEPFKRLHGDRQYEGTGVGLAICALVCERHGWTIAADSRPDVGSTFRVVMPARTVR